jgi:hypothetical protein
MKRLVRCVPLLWIALAISVFALGLQCKLSLYSPSRSISSRAPISKLLSQEDQCGMEQGEHSVDGLGRWIPPANLLLGILAAFTLFLDSQLAAVFRQRRDQRMDCSIGRSPFLRGLASAFLRPPPVPSTSESLQQ